MPINSGIPEHPSLSQFELLRVKQILQIVPVSRSNWWAGVKALRYPQPIKLSEKVTVWRASDIRVLIEKGVI